MGIVFCDTRRAGFSPSRRHGYQYASRAPGPRCRTCRRLLVGDLYPLRSAEAVSALLRGIKTHPRGIPNRALKI